MKKFIAILIYFTFFANSAFADIWDVLYAKNSPSLVREKPYVNSNIIAELKTWYVVLDKGTLSNKWTRILLTDWKIWYIYNFNIWKNKWSKYEIKWNYWLIDETSEIRQLPSSKSNLIWMLYENDNFELMHMNYIFGIWAKIRILDWTHKWEIWYIAKEKIILSCNYENWYDVFKSTFNFKNIPDTSYCSRIKVNGNSSSSSSSSSSTNSSSSSSTESLQDFLDNLNGIMNDTSDTTTTNTTITTEDEDIWDFLDNLNDVLNDTSDTTWSTTNTTTTSSTNTTSTTSDTSMEDFLKNLWDMLN